MAEQQQQEQNQEAEQEWTEECNELIDQVVETQKEIASLLQSHEDSTESLEHLKKQCDEELVELKEDAWRLQMLVELERMGQQLECLAGQDDAAGTNATLQDAAGAGPGAAGEHQTALQDLDKEIAELDKQLGEARAELKGLLQDKEALHSEVEQTGKQLEALAVGASS